MAALNLEFTRQKESVGGEAIRYFPALLVCGKSTVLHRFVPYVWTKRYLSRVKGPALYRFVPYVLVQLVDQDIATSFNAWPLLSVCYI